MKKEEQEITPQSTFASMTGHRPIWAVGPLLVFAILSLPLFLLIHLWKTKNGRSGVGEYLLPLAVFGICLLLLLIFMFGLWIYLSKSYKRPEFKWAILFLVLGLLFLTASFQFLVAMPTDGDEGWTYLFGTLTYPFFVGFSSIWFLFYITVSLTTSKDLSTKSGDQGASK